MNFIEDYKEKRKGELVKRSEILLELVDLVEKEHKCNQLNKRALNKLRILQIIILIKTKVIYCIELPKLLKIVFTPRLVFSSVSTGLF